MRTLIMAAVVASGITWGCAAAGSPGRGPVSSDRNRITREQLEVLPSMTALDAIQRYRLDWLRGSAAQTRGDGGRNTPGVFLDGRPYGDLNALDRFNVDDLEEIRFLNGPDATTRFGTGYPAGIIDIITRRNAAPS